MLRKARNAPASGASESTAPSVAPAAPRSPDKTIIGEHISIVGDIRGQEDLLIQGAVKGSVDLSRHHLTVGVKGKVEGEIMAANVTISGHLVGNIKASGKVEITKEADFTGEIKAKRISVEDGAYLKAVIELEREDTSRSVSSSTAPPAKPGSAPKAAAGSAEGR